MKASIAWFARNPVAANLLMVCILVGGLLAFSQAKMEVFPSVDSDIVSIAVRYPGASPAAVETGVCIPIEEGIEGVEGIERIESTASEGLGVVVAKIHRAAEADAVIDEIKTAVDAIDMFPAEVEAPVVKRGKMKTRVVSVAVSGDVEESTLREYGEKVRDDLAQLPGVTAARLHNARKYEVSIEVSEASLNRYSLTFDDVVDAVRRSSVDLPAGSITTAATEIRLRTNGLAHSTPDFENIAVVAGADGARVVVGDVARVIDGFEESNRWARFDGRPSLTIQVFRVGEQHALTIAAQVDDYVRRAQRSLPPGISLTTWQDESIQLRARLENLMENGRLGFLLIFVVLTVVLRFRLAFWVGLGVPIAVLGTFAVLPWFGVSINLLSLFAFLVVLGILVDDAIVVGERIHTRQSRGEDPVEAAIGGTHDVAVPVTFGALTTIATFSPLLVLPGAMGRMTRQIPIVVILALVFSFIESKLILPAHLAHQREVEGKAAPPNAWSWFQAAVASAFDRFANGTYARLVTRAVDWRYSTAAIGVALVLLCVGLLGGGWLQFRFLPAIEGDNVVAFVTLPEGTPARVTAQAIEALESSAMAVRTDLDHIGAAAGGSIFRHTFASVGEQPYRDGRDRESKGAIGTSGTTAGASHAGEVHIELAPSETRRVGSDEIARLWREKTGPIPDAVELGFTASLFDSGKPLHFELRGRDGDRLRRAAAVLRRRLEQYPGVFEISDSFRGGRPEATLQIRDSAQALGLSLQDLARQVRQAFHGEEVQRIQRGRDDVRVVVRYPRSSRRSLGDIEGMHVRTSNGTAVPFSAIASYEIERGYATIHRADRERVVSVTADVNPEVTSAATVVADVRERVLPKVIADFPGVTYTMQGEQAETAEFRRAMLRGFAVALLAVYVLLAIPLSSYVQPVVIMTAIPFGMVGAIFGHLLMNWDLSMFSVIGMVAVSGVVVNDSLVLVDQANRLRAPGAPPLAAIGEAGRSRLRPILLTSLTTFAGLSPLLFEQSVQAQFLIPMAISMAFGILFSTAVTLLLVPAVYAIVQDLGSARESVRWVYERAFASEGGSSRSAEIFNDRRTSAVRSSDPTTGSMRRIPSKPSRVAPARSSPG